MIKVILKLYDFKLIYLKMIMSKGIITIVPNNNVGVHTLTITREDSIMAHSKMVY